jgi:Family of unknown function (DUF5690)
VKTKFSEVLTSIYIAIICFLTYACVYAFRKPFTIGLYNQEHAFWGIDYKNILVIAQVLGYTISKFYGIKFVSELNKIGRGWVILILIFLSWLPLFIFPLIHSNWSVVCLFLNGLPLGILWGLIFSFIEGRKATDFMGATMAVSFIVSSGFVKTVAKWLQLNYSLQEKWIPFYTGLVFIIPVIILVLLLEKIPGPTLSDIQLKSKRIPLDAKSRKKFFNMFSFGLIAFIIIYILLTLFRDIRDNFAADIWLELGYGNSAAIFTETEIPIAFIVLIIIASMIYVKNNKLAFQLAQIIILSGFVICGISTCLFMNHILSGYLWIILVGLGLYLGYIPFNSILFDRMIAAYRLKGNVGYFMYLVDSFGYLASVFIIFIKGSFGLKISWTLFYQFGVLALSIFGSIISVVTLIYFNKKYKTYTNE